MTTSIWNLRLHWKDEKQIIQRKLSAGEYTFSPLSELRLPDKKIELWAAQDALVLKAMAIVLGESLEPLLSDRCYHLKGHGGAKKAIREIHHQLYPGQQVMKSDIRSYYASMDHRILYEQLEAVLPDRKVLLLLWQYMRRCICYGGMVREVKQGISLGCSLSPLMGALYLKPLDDCVKKTGLFYARFMDDWIILAPTRCKLRSAIRAVNETLKALKLGKHPDKTFIGRVERGFDFLGYHFTPEGLTLARSTLLNFVERAIRLYEQEQGTPYGVTKLWMYARHWVRWALCPNFTTTQ